MKKELDKILDAEQKYQMQLEDTKNQRKLLLEKARIEADLEIEKLWVAFEEEKKELNDEMELRLAKNQKEVFDTFEKQRIALRKNFEENKEFASNALIKGVFVYGDS